MSAQTNIVAFDGASTPVSHTLLPISSARAEDGSLEASWREGLVSLPLAAQIRCATRQRKLKSGLTQVSLTVTVPVMESVSGVNAAGYTAAPKVAYENTMVINGYFSERASIAERRLVRQLALNIAGGIATSVTPVATGPAAELVDQNITAS